MVGQIALTGAARDPPPDHAGTKASLSRPKPVVQTSGSLPIAIESIGQDPPAGPPSFIPASSKHLNHKDFSKRGDLARSMLSASMLPARRGWRKRARGCAQRKRKMCSRAAGCIHTERVDMTKDSKDQLGVYSVVSDDSGRDVCVEIG